MNNMKRGIKGLLIGVMVLVSSTNVWASSKVPKNQQQLELNGIMKTVPGGITVKEGRVLLPIRWLASEMGASRVEWDEKEHTITVEIPGYSEEHQYLSYLAGLQYGKNDKDFPLAKRLQDLELPPYPLNSDRPGMLHQRPIGITLTDDGFSIPFAAYDYEVIDGKLYVGSGWFNTMFLAQIEEDNGLVKIVYPTEIEIKEKLAKLEAITAPTTPEETLALWIRGQQVRSGSLQYSALCPELKEKVLARKGGWVTGGSSPSAGKATILNKEQLDEGSIRYTIKIDEMLQGQISGEIIETLEMKKYEIKEDTYWLISSVKGDTGYYSILPDEN